jgi:predicted esterase YcpF (UPF0227 family)
MSAPTIIYLHGFNSSPQSVKGRAIARAAAALPDPPRLHVPELAHRPAQAMRDVCAWIESSPVNSQALALVGSSLGGYYATWLAERYGREGGGHQSGDPSPPRTSARSSVRSAICTRASDTSSRSRTSSSSRRSKLRGSRVPKRYFLLVRTGDEILDLARGVGVLRRAHSSTSPAAETTGWEDFGAEVASLLRFCGCELHGILPTSR